MRILIAVAGLCVASASAHADGRDHWFGANVLVGPLFGIRLGGPPGSRGILGVEGGIGDGPERINLGFEHRHDKVFGYVEIDPWFFVGGSLGIGIDSDANVHPVLGVWEGTLLQEVHGGCGSIQQDIATIAVGYRFSGVQELYVTIKAGRSERVCL